MQNISHLLVHTAKHSLNMHSTLIGHISTGSQVPEQSRGAGAGRAGTEPPAETFIWSWRGEGTAPGARDPAGTRGQTLPPAPAPALSVPMFTVCRAEATSCFPDLHKGLWEK